MSALLVTLGIAALAVGTIVAALTVDYRARRRTEGPLAALAEPWNLSLEPTTALDGPALRGAVDDHTVRVYFDSDDEGESYTYVELLIASRPPLSIGREGAVARLRRALLGDDVQVGIPRFDDEYLLKGTDPADVVSHLGSPAREAVEDVVGLWRGHVKNGRILMKAKGLLKRPEDVRAQIEAAVRLALALSDHPGSNAEALLKHAFDDPDPGFRRRCLELLFLDYPRSDAGQRALERADTHDDPLFRFLSAKQRGPAGHDRLRALLADDALPHDLAGQARALLGVAEAGGLALSDVGAGGELQVVAEAGGLTEAEPQRARPRIKA